MRERHFPRLCRSCQAPMGPPGRQVLALRRRLGLHRRTAGRAPLPESHSSPRQPRGAIQAQLDADRWIDEGSSLGAEATAPPPTRREEMKAQVCDRARQRLVPTGRNLVSGGHWPRAKPTKMSEKPSARVVCQPVVLCARTAPQSASRTIALDGRRETIPYSNPPGGALRC
jgi:hypothetical protein